jgi:hypothetical protein
MDNEQSDENVSDCRVSRTATRNRRYRLGGHSEHGGLTGVNSDSGLVRYRV